MEKIPENQPYRTSYHFQPPQNWMNDPNGPMYYKGVYHFFYQHNPIGADFGHNKMVWGHAISYDLINWVHLKIAIEPSGKGDIRSCFSGSATIISDEKEQKIYMLYTGIDANNDHQVQYLAMPKDLSDPFLRDWENHPQNPVMTAPIGVEKEEFRDPSTAWKGSDGKWRVLIGARNGDEGKTIISKTENFVDWEVDPNPFYATENTGVCECPDFFPVSINSTNGVDYSGQISSVRHVFKISYLVRRHDYYFIGTYSDEDKFIPDVKFVGTNSSELRFDYGSTFYASKTFFDYAKNRRILWGWVEEADNKEDAIERGWAGLQTIPRQIWLDKSGKRLMQWPVEEVEKLRYKQISLVGQNLEGGSTLEVKGITASQVDVEVLFELPDLQNAEYLDPIEVDPDLLCREKYASKSGIIGPFGLLALASKDQTESVAISFRIYKTLNRYVCLMSSDDKSSSLRKNIRKTTRGAIIDIDPNVKTISLRSLIDRSIVESFGDGGKVCITSRAYPLLAIDKDAHLFVFNKGSQSVGVSNLNAWSMKQAEFGSA